MFHAQAPGAPQLQQPSSNTTTTTINNQQQKPFGTATATTPPPGTTTTTPTTTSTTNNNNNNNNNPNPLPVVTLFNDLGYAASYSSPVILAVLDSAGISPANAAARIADADVAALLAMMAASHSGLPANPTLRSLLAPLSIPALSDPELDQMRKMPSWNIELFFPVLLKLNPEINWTNVLRNLDAPDSSFADAASFAVVLKASKAVLQDIYAFPTNVFLDQWANSRAQLNFVRHTLQMAPELLTVARTLPRRVILPEMVPPGTLGRSILAAAAASPWNSLELIQCIMRLCETPYAEETRALLDMGIQQSPDLILLAFSQLIAPWSSIVKEYGPSLVVLLLAGHTHAPYVLPRVWQFSPGLFVSGLVLMHSKNPSSLARILDIAQEIKALTQILETKPLSFSIDLAALASRREYLNLEKWLQDHIRDEGSSFVTACLEFLGSKMSQQLNRTESSQSSPPSVPLLVDVVRIFLRILHANSANMSPENTALFKELLAVCSQAFPQLTGNAEDVLYSDGPAFPPDIDQEANTYYARLYKGELSIGQFLEMLQRLKTSTAPRDQQVFRCTIQSLFGEFEFFKEYPERELAITSMIFGLMIQNQIVSSTDLGIALRFVLDTLRQPVGSKLFNFGLQALKQFQNRLSEWPQYSALLLQIEHLHVDHPEIIQVIKNFQEQAQIQASNGISPKNPIDAAASLGRVKAGPTTPSKEVARLGSTSASLVQDDDSDTPKENSVFTAVGYQFNPSDTAPESPPESVQDKILFIVNNVSQDNLKAKVVEMVELLKPPYYDWFGQYLVVKRVSIELNFHSVYIALLDSLDAPVLYRHILRETLYNIHLILNSEKTVTSSQERSLLKNLGTWLGGISLAKDKPIRHKHLSIKDLLMQGYNSGRLIVVIPFVCKVLEQCASSRAFRPPNPWLMAIMRLLVELYHFAELKLNLKFEIEVLCKNIKLDVKDIAPTDILRTRMQRVADKEIEREAAVQARSDAQAIAGAASASVSGASAASAGASSMQQQSQQQQQQVQQQQQQQQQQHSGAESISTDDPAVGYPSLASYITFNPNIAIFSTQPSLKRIVHIAIDRSIREVILSPVVERSVTIAVIATRELAIKDFALEPNEDKMRKAAHWMVQSLAGSLASVSSREPLRVSMISNLRSLLLQNGFTEQTVPEQVVHVIVSDNLELACSVMEKAAADKAAPEIDESLAVAYMGRRKHRERTNQPYYDINVYSSSRYPANLPESLRLRVNGPSLSQLRLYEDFLRVPHAPDRQARIVSAAQQQQQQQQGRPDMQAGSGIPVHAMHAPHAAHHAAALQAHQAHATHPGQVPPQLSASQGVPEEPIMSVSPQQITERFGVIIAELDKQLSENPDLTLATLPRQHEIRILMIQIPQLLAQTPAFDEFALLFSQKVVQLLYKSTTTIARIVYILILKRFCEMSKPLSKELKEWFLYHDDERKYDVSVALALLENELLGIAEFEMQLARQIETVRPSVAEFAAALLRTCLIDRRDLAFHTDFLFTIQSLRKLVVKGKATESVVKLLEDIDRNSAIASVQDIGMRDVDAGTLRDQLGLVFQEWVHTFYHPSSSGDMHLEFVNLLQGVLRSDVVSPLFFRVCAEVSVESYRAAKASGAPPARTYQAVDAFAHLLVLLITQFTDPNVVDQGYARINLTARALSILVLVLVHAHEQSNGAFDQRPFFRLFSSFLNNLRLFETQLQPIYIQILSAVSNTLHTLQPLFLPGFTFAWLQLIAHRNFMPRLLLSESQKCWPYFQRLLVDMFKFMGPLLRQPHLSEPVRLLYRGTLRILLVLLHDFPEFLCDYHFSLVDVIPRTCIQLRNLILSAFPRNMRLPDPFAPNLKIDLLPEISQSPRILSDYTTSLMVNHFKQDVDTYLKTRGPVSFLIDLRSRLLVSDASGGVSAGSAQKSAAAAAADTGAQGSASSSAVGSASGATGSPVGDGANASATGVGVVGPRGASSADASSKYNIPMINALVLYVGVQAIAQAQHKQLQGNSPITHSAPMDIFQQLVVDLDTEGRYLFLSAIANQLRYPNSHTHYFSCVLLYLFAEASQEIIQEQITRVLIERLIVNRPHPYGLLITFIELIRNPRYNFWDHSSFIHGAPEIERLFQNVAKSINNSMSRIQQ